MTTSGEEIDGTKEDKERDNDVSDGDKDVNRYAIRDGGGSDADEWESGGSDGDKDKGLLETEDIEKAAEEEDTEEEVSEEERSGGSRPPAKGSRDFCRIQ